MFKKLLYLSVFLIPLSSLISQNLQVHYDFGDGRNYITTTVEQFKPDSYGSTFFFVDFNHSKKGASEAYWEIARDLKFWDFPIAAHFEYNGGLNSAIRFNNCYLVGVSYSWNAPDFSKGFTLQAMYKNIERNQEQHNFQLTGVWYLHLFNGKFTFSGFADFWREKHYVSKDNFQNHFKKSNFVFLSEPQIWYNINKTFSVGSEIELSNDFAGMYGFKVNPTVAIKYNF
ncbi:MAG: DUF5020 family protein [Bacteroidota bacterium]